MEIKFLSAIVSIAKDSKWNTNIKSELGVDEIKNYIQQKSMVWTCDAEEKDDLRKYYTQMEGKLPRGRYWTRWTDQIRKDIEIKGAKWEEIQENRKWENRDDLEIPL